MIKRLNSIGAFYGQSTNAVKWWKKQKWSGSCYGFALSVAMNRAKEINIRKYTKSSGNGFKLNKVKMPKNSKRVKSLLNYYQISQMYIPFSEKQFYRSKPNNKESYEKWVNGNKFIVKNAQKGYLQMLKVYFKYAGHQILVKGIDKDKKKSGWYVLSTYDCNYPKKNTHIYIKKDFTNCTFKFENNYEKTLGKIDALCSNIRFDEYVFLNIDK